MPRRTTVNRELFARDVVNRYLAGQSIRQIAEATDSSFGLIHALLHENDVRMRPLGGQRKPAFVPRKVADVYGDPGPGVVIPLPPERA